MHDGHVSFYKQRIFTRLAGKYSEINPIIYLIRIVFT